MFSVEDSIHIDRPRQVIFDYVTDPANSHKWQGATVSAEWISEGPAGAGSRQRILTRFMGRDIESTSEFAAWEPPDCCVFRVVNGPIPVEGTWRFESNGNGTLCTMSGKIDAGGFFKLAEGLIRKQVDKQHKADLETLKQLLEAG